MSAASRKLADDAMPGPLPAGESILWQGSPDPATLFRDALHARLVGAYFGLAAVAVAGIAWSAGWPLPLSVAALAILGASAGIVLGLLRVFAALVGRTTCYTITNRRVVMRIGVALPVTLNIPFAIVEGAALRPHPGGAGDIPIALRGIGRIGVLHLWPHARPWRVSRPEPMLRAVPQAGQVAAILARALGAGQLGQAAAARQDAAPGQARAATAAA